MKGKLYNIFIAFILLIIVLLNTVAIFWFNQIVFNELESSAKMSLKEMANDEKRAISLIVQGKEQSLLSLAELISQTGNDTNDLLSHMEKWQRLYDIENIFITSVDGSGISSTGENIDISNETYLKTSLVDEAKISGVHKSLITGNNVMIATAPIYYNDSLEGILVAEYSLEYLTGLLMDTTDTRGSSMIVNGQGSILMHTYPFEISFENFKQAQFEEDKTYADILNDFRLSKEGSIVFTINNVRKLGEYIPLGIEDWSLFFEISEEALSASAEAITNTMLIISICIALTFTFFMYYILRARKKTLKEIEKVVYFDKLTGIPNLIKFKIDVEKLLQKKDFDASEYAIVKCDLENFKAINEICSFEVGNRVIRTVANYIKKIGDSSVKYARTGTDEFIVFAQKEIIDQHLTFRNTFTSLIKEYVPEVGNHQFSFRYGRYFLERGEKNIDEIVSKVSMAHSFARKEGGSAVWNYDNTFKSHLIHLTELTNKMRSALENNDFKMYVQPKYSLQDEQIIGLETLVRWIEPDGNIVYPNDFIPLFEKNEFILELDKYMFENTCKTLQKWILSGHNIIPISVNFSRLNFKNPHFVRELKEIAEKYQVPLEYLEIELTETSIIENEGIFDSVIKEIRRAGFLVSVDDFGSGYSSLGMLKDYNVDIIKLDRSFFSGTKKETSADIVVEGIIDLIKNLGKKTIAEGIETKEQIDFLKKTDCYAVQGYYFAKPMSIEEFENLNGYST